MAVPQELPEGFAQQTKGPTVLAVCISLTTVATVFVAARLYVRVKILSRLGLDDWLIIVSMVSTFFIMLSLAQHADASCRYVATSCLASR